MADTLVVPFNDVEAVEQAVAAHGTDLAAIIVEPVCGNMGAVAPKPGYLEALRELTPEERDAPDLRRGDHRLPPRARRRAGALRHHARPDLPRQDPRRRPARRGVRRPGRHHGHGRARGPGLPGRHALREPAGDGRRARRSSTSSRSRARYETLEARSARLEEGLRRAARDGRRDGDGQPRRLDDHRLLLRGAGHRLRDREGVRHEALRPVLPRHARARASTCRRRSSRRRSSRSPTARPRSTRPSRPRPRPSGRRPDGLAGAASRHGNGLCPKANSLRRSARGRGLRRSTPLLRDRLLDGLPVLALPLALRLGVGRREVGAEDDLARLAHGEEPARA